MDDILSSGKKYGCEELLYVLRTLVTGFSILQQNGISHRDIKPENIILVEDDTFNGEFLYKISNFANSCRLEIGDTTITAKSLKVLSKFAAPEVSKLFEQCQNDEMFDNEYNPFKADVFSLGILVLKMICYEYDKNSLVNKKNFFRKLSLEYKKLIPILEKMLEENPNNRIDFQSLDILLERNMNRTLSISNPEDEIVYYEKYINMKEQKIEKTIEGIINLYQTHFGLFTCYYKNQFSC